jgi:hypothetical protein
MESRAALEIERKHRAWFTRRWFCEVCGERSTTASRYGVRARTLHGTATEGVVARHYYTGRWAKSLSFKPGQICGNSAGVTADGLWRCEEHWFT